MERIDRPDAEWREKLEPERYAILRESGTEPPFSGALYHNEATGTYLCGGCGAGLFTSETKYDSGIGWPSFFAPSTAANLALREDRAHGMVRTEVRCARCDSHLGHLFDDGPAPTGARYCINSLALTFAANSVPEHEA